MGCFYKLGFQSFRRKKAWMMTRTSRTRASEQSYGGHSPCFRGWDIPHPLIRFGRCRVLCQNYAPGQVSQGS